jgi:malate dehydrogenase (oxaloacetate-decarboxylating)
MSPTEPLDHSNDPAFAIHRGGKIEVTPTIRVRDNEGLALAYTPGVARVSAAIAENAELAYDYTWKGHSVLVVTDGSAVLGLGDIGPLGALPVMEGKALLFKEFGGLDAVPICLDTKDVGEIVDTVVRIAPAYGGVNLEDISAPRCFEIEDALKERLDIPVFHDDQHGTAIVVTAAMINACRLTGRTPDSLRVVISGAGAAGVAVTAMLMSIGVKDVVVLDSKGILSRARQDISGSKADLASRTNPNDRQGGLAEALNGADVYIGVSGGSVPEEIVASMAPGCIIFGLANPTPEIHPEIAARYAAVVATGRSDFPNQINNVLAFPGVFRGALEVRARAITEGMKIAAAQAIADLISDVLTPEYIVPGPFDRRVGIAVADAVSRAARADGVARI